MKPQAFQPGEIRDENDNIIQNGAYGKRSAFVNAQNDGILDYIMNNFDVLYAEHEKLQNAIDSSLKNEIDLGSSTNPNQVITIPMRKGMYLLVGYPDGFTTLDDKYPYALIVNFKSSYGGILSLYIQDQKRDIYYRTGWEDVWRTGWTKLATTDEIPTKVSQLSNDSGYQKTAEIPVASKTQNGYMSKYDKAKLDGLSLESYVLKSDYSKVVLPNGHISINGSELWIE